MYSLPLVFTEYNIRKKDFAIPSPIAMVAL